MKGEVLTFAKITVVPVDRGEKGGLSVLFQRGEGSLAGERCLGSGEEDGLCCLGGEGCVEFGRVDGHGRKDGG